MSNNNSNNNNFNILYRFNKKKGVEKINIKTGECKIVLDRNNSSLKNHPSSFFYQNNTIKSCLYLFQEEKYYTLNTNTDSIDMNSSNNVITIPTTQSQQPPQQPPQQQQSLSNSSSNTSISSLSSLSTCEWKSSSFSMNEEIYSQSSIYDGMDNIFLFGGETDSNNSTAIFKFNIHKKEFKLLESELPVPGKYHSLSRDGDDIFICGGEDHSDNYLNRIDSFNIRTQKIKNIAKIPLSHYLINSGIYVAKYQCFFLLSVSDVSNFYRYDPSTNKSTKLTEFGEEIYFSKLFYDGESDIIVLITNGSEYLHLYNIKDNTVQDVLVEAFIDNPISHYDYVTLSTN